MKKYILIGIIVLAFLGAIYATYLIGCEDDWCFQYEWQKVNATNSFEECEARGFPIMESYPPQCRAGNKTFVKDLNANTSQNINQNGSSPDCEVAGCSSQLCVDSSIANDLVTTCEFLAEYSCYRTARCEKQYDGKCGWTQTTELQSCIEKSRQGGL
ncbi:MAG TPA: hypothetical protein VJC11_01505 [Patescibacteria group bacterium]|nr:hypothetical protein [Patescibacteria group bacterium]